MAKKSEKKEEKKPVAKKAATPKIKRVPGIVKSAEFKLGGKPYKKGETVLLTEKGKLFYQSKNYIE